MNPLARGHVYLQRYRVIAVAIVGFFIYQTYDLTMWYKLNFHDLNEWQNAPIVGLITGYVAALKYALSHITEKGPHDHDAS
jgi:uncharacterized membrane protein